MFDKSILKEHSLPPPTPKKQINQRFHKTGARLIIALLSLVLLSATAFGQSSASLGGTVMDASRAVLPGAEVTARNDATGVESKTTANNAGVYNFPSLQSGTYTVAVELRGFQRNIKTDVRLGAGSQIRLDFDLAVAGTTTEVEVTSTTEHMILEAGSSTGTVLQEEALKQVPLVSNDTMELINIMGGVIRSENPTFYGDLQTFAGVAGNNINISRDGISVNEIRHNSGITSPARLNPEMVGEFKMILSPVDAEMGRGAGQVQMTTRSGSNTFHGSGVWNVQNTALDAFDYNAKHMAPELITPRQWRNLHNYTLSLSGPIIQNKTFFFVTWDQAIARTRTTTYSTVLTPCARKGIYRWLSNTRSGNAALVNPSIDTSFQGPNPGRSAYRPVVNADGTPRYQYEFPNTSNLQEFAGKTVTETLQFQSVLGPLDAAVRNGINPLTCDGYLTANAEAPIPINANFGVTGTWDNYRTQYDQSGFISRFSNLMPLPNDYQRGDGLNTAAYRWTRRGNGGATIFGGSLYDDNRKAITVRIDHNINSAHRIGGTYSYESNYGDDAERTWPEANGGYGGLIERKPQTFTVTLTSTLLPTLLNEFRMGAHRTDTMTYEALGNPQTKDKMSAVLLELIDTTDSSRFPRYNGFEIVAGPGGNNTSGGGANMLFHPLGNNSGPYSSRGIMPVTWGGQDTRWTFGDTATWMKGVHAFKGGVEFRAQKSFQRNNGAISGSVGNTVASIRGGVMQGDVGDYSPNRTLALSGVDSAGNAYWPNMPKGSLDYVRAGESLLYPAAAASGNYASAYNLLTYLTGSIANINEYFYAVDSNHPRWNLISKGELERTADLRNREFAFFFKDDWKANASLTLNLGVRYEYYGAPWEANGWAAGVKDGMTGAMGASGGDLSTWMPSLSTLLSTGVNGDTKYRTEQVLVGPNSPNPNLSVHGADYNNFAPHVGFSWQLPWFGRGQTTLRGGYSISYTKISNFDTTFGYSAVISQAPGLQYNYTYSGHQGDAVLNQGCLPGQPYGTCYLNYDNFGRLMPLYDEQNGWVGYSAANQPQILYAHAIDRREMTLQLYDPEIRTPYIQNMTLSLTRQVGRNFTLDVRYIGTLSRKGMASTSYGLNLNVPNLINSGLMEELIKVRAGGDSAIFNNYIKPGTLFAGNTNGSAQIRSMYATNMATGNLQAVLNSLATANFGNNTMGCNGRCINPSGTRGNVLRYGGAPENLIYANPQFAAVYVKRNQDHSNYHSMQAQVTMRPAHGLNFQATYTWSRNLARSVGTALTDYRNWTGDYDLAQMHRGHQLNLNGSYTLPFGPKGYILRNTTGAFKKALEDWRLGWIYSATSGAPYGLAGATTLWANGTLNQVGPFDRKQGKVEWDDEAGWGLYYGKDKYDRIIDPMCTDVNVVAESLRSNCVSGLRALVEVDNNKEIAGYKNWTSAGGYTNPVRGTIIFQNAKPGERGNFRPNSLYAPGRWSLDANLGKSVEFMEGKRIEVRIEAQNVFNHATPTGRGSGMFDSGGSSIGSRGSTISNPTVTVNTTEPIPFGQMYSKGGHRTFQGSIRLSF